MTDVVVHVARDVKPQGTDTMDVLLVVSSGQKDAKIYTSLEDVGKDWGIDSVAYKKTVALFDQGKAKPTPKTLVRKIIIVGTDADTPSGLVDFIKDYQCRNNDWSVLITDRTEEEYIRTIGEFAADSEPTTAELIAGVEDHRKLYFAETNNVDLNVKTARTVIIYTDNLEEHADAAWLGAVLPWYPTYITWKFKMPVGLSIPFLPDGSIRKLEENHINFVTNEYKKNYIKNGVCADGEWIDAVLGADWITRAMREKLYDTFIQNPIIPYTNAGFNVIAAAIFAALDAAVDYGIIARDESNGVGIYTLDVPCWGQSTDEERRTRTMPAITWTAQLNGAVHGVIVSGILKVSI